MWSATAVATPGQQLLSASGAKTYRTYFKTRVSGKLRYAFWVSNGVDTTYGTGPIKPNAQGGAWTIEAAFAADGGSANHDGSVVAGSSVPVTFGGSRRRLVDPGEKLWSDPVSLELPANHELAFTWTLSGTGYPFVSATFHTSYRANENLADRETGSGFSATTEVLVAPALVGYDHPVQKRLCFLGDSITQGVGTTDNKYGYWAAKIAAGLDPSIGVWNLGSGWARAADASSDGYWLYKAKQCDELAVILGVNDLGSSGSNAQQINEYLMTILTKVKASNPAAKTILFTVPPYNYGADQLTYWRTINSAIRSQSIAGTDRVFDFAAILSQPAPNEGNVQTRYLSPSAPPHPNDAAGTDIASAFLSWYAASP
jgi:lysophospholipase L1-like esterase